MVDFIHISTGGNMRIALSLIASLTSLGKERTFWQAPITRQIDWWLVYAAWLVLISNLARSCSDAGGLSQLTHITAIGVGTICALGEFWHHRRLKDFLNGTHVPGANEVAEAITRLLILSRYRTIALLMVAVFASSHR